MQEKFASLMPLDPEQPTPLEEERLSLTIQALREMDTLQQQFAQPPEGGAAIQTLEDAARGGYFTRKAYPALWAVEEYYRSGGRTEQPPVELSLLHEAGYVPGYVLELLHGNASLLVQAQEATEEPPKEAGPEATIQEEDKARLLSLLQMLVGR